MPDTEIISIAVSLLGAAGKSSDTFEFCRSILLDAFSSWNATATGLIFLAKDGTMKLDAQSTAGVSHLGEAPIPAEVSGRLRDAMLARSATLIELAGPDDWRPSVTLASHVLLCFPGQLRGLPSVVLYVAIPRESMGDRDALLAELDALVIGALDSLLFRLDIESLKKNGARISGFPDFESLTDRQRAILDMLVDGKTNREISRSLCVSESLVKQENMTIFKALGTRNRHETSRIARLRTLHADAPPRGAPPLTLTLSKGLRPGPAEGLG